VISHTPTGAGTGQHETRRAIQWAPLACSLFAILAASHAAKSAANSADPQIESLIARMSVEEKAGQLTLFSDSIRPVDPDINPATRQIAAHSLLTEIRGGRLSGIFQGIGAASARRRTTN